MDELLIIDDLPDPPEALPAVVHEIELAAILGITRQSVSDLARRRVITRCDRARYNLRDTIKAYTQHLREHAARAGRPSQGGDALKAAKTRLAEEQARLAEIKVAEAESRLVDAAAVQREWESILIDIRAALLAIPARLTDIDRNTAIRVDGEIRAVLMELVDGERK